jgi:hypothetical protein
MYGWVIRGIPVYDLPVFRYHCRLPRSQFNALLPTNHNWGIVIHLTSDIFERGTSRLLYEETGMVKYKKTLHPGVLNLTLLSAPLTPTYPPHYCFY